MVSDAVYVAIISGLALVLVAVVTGFMALMQQSREIKAETEKTYHKVNSGMEELIRLNKQLYEEIGRAKGIDEERERAKNEAGGRPRQNS